MIVFEYAILSFEAVTLATELLNIAKTSMSLYLTIIS